MNTNNDFETITKNLKKDISYYDPWYIKYNFSYKALIQPILLVSITIFITYLFDKVSMKHGKKKAYNIIQFPFIFMASLYVFFAIYKLGYQTQHLDEQTSINNSRELSKITQQIVVDGWESDAMKHKYELSDMYEEIFSKPCGNENGFMNEHEWNKLGLNVPYVSYKGNEIKWHYAAKFIQEMTNIYRLNDLGKTYKIGSIVDLAKSKLSANSGWFSSFRMWMSHPIVRNVYEQYKYRHINPEFTAWVKFYIIDTIEGDASYWKGHRKRWDKATEIILQRKH